MGSENLILFVAAGEFGRFFGIPLSRIPNAVWREWEHWRSRGTLIVFGDGVNESEAVKVERACAEAGMCVRIFGVSSAMPVVDLCAGLAATVQFARANTSSCWLEIPDWISGRLRSTINSWLPAVDAELASGAKRYQVSPTVPKSNRPPMLQPPSPDAQPAQSTTRAVGTKHSEQSTPAAHSGPMYSLADPHAHLKSRFGQILKHVGMVGRTKEFWAIVERSAALAASDVPILILGESGTGKELLARFIHAVSDRASGPFVALNCTAIPRELVESTLFGHRKGSFTGAIEDATGKFRQADGGTLFLDEIGDLPLDLQPKLLRILEDQMVEPVGGNRAWKVNVRILAATNTDVTNMVRTGRLRADLYYRLKVGVCQLPSLRQRNDDIYPIVRRTLERLSERYGRSCEITPEGTRFLRGQQWPGNIRELVHFVEAAFLLSTSENIGPQDLQLVDQGMATQANLDLPPLEEGFSMIEFLAEVRRRLIQRAMDVGGSPTRAAKLLGVSPQALMKAMKRFE